MIIKSPVSGKKVELNAVSDPVFSQKMMGDGIALEPTSNEFVAPVSGELTSVFPTKHAYCLVSDEGVELLLHIGLNTVELGGEYFDCHVKQGQHVRRGEKLVTVDLQALKDRGYSVVTPLIILNSGQYHKISVAKQNVFQAGEPLLEVE